MEISLAGASNNSTNNMKIKTAHCFFEQSGTFKNEFKKLGIDAYDYDIQNNFGQTDYIIDLFAEIENAYDDKPSIFDNITSDDLIMAFFPCIYFATMQMVDFSLSRNGTQNKPLSARIEYALDRLEKRTKFHSRLYKLVAICDKRKLKLIIENPATEPNYLISGCNFVKPTIIDNDRTLRGDCFKKPTAYWFFNCKNTYGESYKRTKEVKKILDGVRPTGDGLCSSERSMITPEYAKNFICDFILGQPNENTRQKLLFN